MKSKKARKIARKGGLLRQVAALPYRRSETGSLELLLISSRGTRRFLIPKGWRVKGQTGHVAAALEAEQEAGVVGSVNPAPIGTFQYWKRVRKAFVPVRVDVYALLVEQELTNWKERQQRRRKWLEREQAASLIDEPELVSMVMTFAPMQQRAD